MTSILIVFAFCALGILAGQLSNETPEQADERTRELHLEFFEEYTPVTGVFEMKGGNGRALKEAGKAIK